MMYDTIFCEMSKVWQKVWLTRAKISVMAFRLTEAAGSLNLKPDVPETVCDTMEPRPAKMFPTAAVTAFSKCLLPSGRL